MDQSKRPHFGDGTRLELAEIQNALREFAREREWDQFHAPKNVVMALSVECSELMEHFQWLSQEESWQFAELSQDDPKKAAIGEELADVLLYALRLSDLLNIDVAKALAGKFVKNTHKYPAEKARGHAKKYTELD